MKEELYVLFLFGNTARQNAGRGMPPGRTKTHTAALDGDHLAPRRRATELFSRMGYSHQCL